MFEKGSKTGKSHNIKEKAGKIGTSVHQNKHRCPVANGNTCSGFDSDFFSRKHGTQHQNIFLIGFSGSYIETTPSLPSLGESVDDT